MLDFPISQIFCIFVSILMHSLCRSIEFNRLNIVVHCFVTQNVRCAIPCTTKPLSKCVNQFKLSIHIMDRSLCRFFIARTMKSSFLLGEMRKDATKSRYPNSQIKHLISLYADAMPDIFWPTKRLRWQCEISISLLLALCFFAHTQCPTGNLSNWVRGVSVCLICILVAQRS